MKAFMSFKNKLNEIWCSNIVGTCECAYYSYFIKINYALRMMNNMRKVEQENAWAKVKTFYAFM